MSQAKTFKVDDDNRFSKRLFEYIRQAVQSNPLISQNAPEVMSQNVNLAKVHMVPYRVDVVFSTKAGIIHHE